MEVSLTDLRPGPRGRNCWKRLSFVSTKQSTAWGRPGLMYSGLAVTRREVPDSCINTLASRALFHLRSHSPLHLNNFINLLYHSLLRLFFVPDNRKSNNSNESQWYSGTLNNNWKQILLLELTYVFKAFENKKVAISVVIVFVIGGEESFVPFQALSRRTVVPWLPAVKRSCNKRLRSVCPHSCVRMSPKYPL